jgi:hypothetical protein
MGLRTPNDAKPLYLPRLLGWPHCREALPAVAPGPRVPVPSGLSRRHQSPSHAHGKKAAYYLPYFHEKRNPARSGRALSGQITSVTDREWSYAGSVWYSFWASARPLVINASTASAARSRAKGSSLRSWAEKSLSTKAAGSTRPGGRPMPKRAR